MPGVEAGVWRALTYRHLFQYRLSSGETGTAEPYRYGVIAGRRTALIFDRTAREWGLLRIAAVVELTVLRDVFEPRLVHQN